MWIVINKIEWKLAYYKHLHKTVKSSYNVNTKLYDLNYWLTLTALAMWFVDMPYEINVLKQH